MPRKLKLINTLIILAIVSLSAADNTGIRKSLKELTSKVIIVKKEEITPNE